MGVQRAPLCCKWCGAWRKRAALRCGCCGANGLGFCCACAPSGCIQWSHAYLSYRLTLGMLRSGRRPGHTVSYIITRIITHMCKLQRALQPSVSCSVLVATCAYTASAPPHPTHAEVEQLCSGVSLPYLLLLLMLHVCLVALKSTSGWHVSCFDEGRWDAVVGGITHGITFGRDGLLLHRAAISCSAFLCVLTHGVPLGAQWLVYVL